MTWKQNPLRVIFHIHCSECGNDQIGTFRKVMLEIRCDDNRVMRIHKPYHYICSACQEEIVWAPNIQDVVDRQERI